jgi:hypothetical protein
MKKKADNIACFLINESDNKIFSVKFIGEAAAD